MVLKIRVARRAREGNHVADLLILLQPVGKLISTNFESTELEAAFSDTRMGSQASSAGYGECSHNCYCELDGDRYSPK
jgi:hypothetical protein